MDKTNKTSQQLLCDYMYNHKTKVTYEDIVKKVNEEKFEEFCKHPLKGLWQAFKDFFYLN